MAKDKQKKWVVEIVLTVNPYLGIVFTLRQNNKPTEKKALKIYARLAEEQDLPCAKLVLRICEDDGGI